MNGNPVGVLQFYDDLIVFKQKIKDHLSLHIQQNEYIQSTLSNTISLTAAKSDTQNTIEPTNEMIQLILNAGETESEILFNQGIDHTHIHAGKFNLDLKTPREIASWKSTLQELENLGLIKDEGYEGRLFNLTNTGWKAFDQIKAQLEKNT